MDLKIILVILCMFVLAESQLQTVKILNHAIVESFPDGIPYRAANFGYYPYGRTLHGLVQFADPNTACEWVQPVAEDYSIMIADRGDCSSVTKGFYAQAAGAKLLIIIDDRDEYIMYHHLYDDGSGRHLTIPVLLISKDVGALLRQKALEIEEPLSFSVYFIKPEERKVADVDYWFSTVDNKTYSFFDQFQETYNQIGKQINFNPHIVLYENYSASIENYTCQDCTHCLGGGRYCHPDPDNLDGLISGRDAIKLDLLNLCTWKTLKNKNTYFDLMTNFSQNCLSQNNQKKRNGMAKDPMKCMQNQMFKLGISYQDTNQCVKDSFMLESHIEELDQNILLDREIELYNNEIVQVYPELYVNRYPIRGDVGVEAEIDSAICSGYSRKHYPSYCQSLFEYVAPEEDDGFIPYWVVVIIVFTVIILVAVVSFMVYRKYIRKEVQTNMASNVNKAVTKYMQMKETSNSNNSYQTE